MLGSFLAVHSHGSQASEGRGHGTHHMPGSSSTGWLVLAVAAEGNGLRVSHPPGAGSRSASFAAARSPLAPGDVDIDLKGERAAAGRGTEKAPAI